MVLLFIVLLAVVVLIHLTIRYYHFYRLAFLIPYPKGIPFLGQALEIWSRRDDLLEYMTELCTKEEHQQILNEAGAAALWLGPVPVFLIVDIQDIEHIMTMREETSKAYQYRFFEPFLGKGLLSSPGGPHYNRNRKIITSAFHLKLFEDFIPIFNNNIDIFLSRLDEKVDKGSFDIEDYVGHLTLDNITECALGVKINAQMGTSKYLHSVKELTEAVFKRMCAFWYYPDIIFNISPFGKKFHKNVQYIDEFILNVINKRKEVWIISQQKKNDKSNSDIGEKEKVGCLDSLLESQRNLPDFTDQDMLAEIKTTVIAGHDSITSCVCSTLYLLSRHPTIQDEVLKEVETVVGEEKFTMANLQDLNYTERVIKESLRLLPPASFVGKSSNEDITLKSGCIIPAGANFFIFVQGLHKRPDLYPDPERFDPDRFLPENCRERSPYAFIPFSAGYRNCIGQKFAFMEIKAIIAATVRRYRILPSEDIKPVAYILLRSSNGVNLILKKRSPQTTCESITCLNTKTS